MLQVKAELARPVQDPDTLAAAGQWMHANIMVSDMTHNQEKVIAEWKQSPQAVLQAAYNVHDAVLSAAVITHLPPSRQSCLRTLLAPNSTSACLHPDCKEPDCQGNRLYLLSTAPLKMKIKLPHHKNERKWNRAVIAFDVPSELAEMLLLYLEGPRKALLQSELLADETCDFVFMDKRCRPFSSSTFCLHWQNFMRSLGGPALAPSICRKIFATERCSDDAAPGPCDRGAAMVMGHSTRQWADWYDIKFHAKLAQHAVDAMTLWRNAMLQRAASQQQSAVTDAVITAVTARSVAAEHVAVTPDALAHATVVDATLTDAASTACFEDSEAESSDADLNTVAKRRCCNYVISSDSDSECDSQPEPAVQHATPQPAQLSDSAQQQATQAEQLAEQAEMLSDMAEFASCSSGSDIEVDLEL